MSVGLHRWTNPNGYEWVCGASDHGPLCRLCQPVDEMMAGILANVDLGRMEVVRVEPDGEIVFKLTMKGTAAAEDSIHNNPEMADLWARLEASKE